MVFASTQTAQLCGLGQSLDLLEPQVPHLEGRGNASFIHSSNIRCDPTMCQHWARSWGHSHDQAKMQRV